MVATNILIDTTVENGTSLFSNLFGYTPLPGSTDYNSLPESDLEDTYTLYVYGAQYISENYDGTPNYRRYSIDSITSTNTLQLAPNLNINITPFTFTDDDWSVQAFTITFTGSLSRATNGAVSMTYRDGLNSPVTTTNFNSFPSTASLTSITSPKGDEYIPLEFSLTSEGNTYPLLTPLYVKHEGVNFPTQTAPKSATRQGDKGTGHGAFGPRPSNGGSSDIFINGIPAHGFGDSWASHTDGDTSHTSTAGGGSSSVYINGKALSRVSDSVACGSKIAHGSETVFSG